MNLPTVNFSADRTVITEGGEAQLLTFNLSEPAPGDVEYNVDGSSGIAEFEFITENNVSDSFNITIAEGETEAVLVSQAISDDVEEGEEIFTTAIAEGDGYQINPNQSEVTTTILDTSTDLNTSTSTSISFELDDLLFSSQEAVADVSFNMDYIVGIEDSKFLDVNTIADSIEDYLANVPSEGDFFEVVAQDLTQFLATDAGLGLSEVAESITVEFNVKPYSAIPFPFAVESTVEIAEI